MPETVSLAPPPVYFVKSISEQGYTLASAISDLIDNSIAAAATRVEILMDTADGNLRLYIADNGQGMTGAELTANMRIPSADLDDRRQLNDLGRFGLGLKTASFSQSRRFTVISRKADSAAEGRTWDVDCLRRTNDWTLIIEAADAADGFIRAFYATGNAFHAQDPDFAVRTLVVWDDLYKLKKLTGRDEMSAAMEELRSHLSLVFHRYLSAGKLSVRLNNDIIRPFEPFPAGEPGVQTVAENYWQSEGIYIRFQGIILPKRAAAEAVAGDSPWVPADRTLEELQGLYVYRNDRLINYGGWLRTIPKSVYLQFGRIRIDISNAADSDFHLNVAKSSLNIPFGLRRAMKQMIQTVASQAAKEYREKVAASVVQLTPGRPGLSLIVRQPTGKGTCLKINEEFELIRMLGTQLTKEQNRLLDSIFTLFEKKLNDIWAGESGNSEIAELPDGRLQEKIRGIGTYYREAGYSAQETRCFLLESFGPGAAVKEFINNLKLD